MNLTIFHHINHQESPIYPPQLFIRSPKADMGRMERETPDAYLLRRKTHALLTIARVSLAVPILCSASDATVLQGGSIAAEAAPEKKEITSIPRRFKLPVNTYGTVCNCPPAAPRPEEVVK